MIIILVFALAACGLGWANAEANKQALEAVSSTMARENGELSFELDRAKAANKATPKGPRFEWDEDDSCWVLKDCVRVDGQVVWFNKPFRAYANYDKRDLRPSPEQIDKLRKIMRDDLQKDVME